MSAEIFVVEFVDLQRGDSWIQEMFKNKKDAEEYKVEIGLSASYRIRRYVPEASA